MNDFFAIFIMIGTGGNMPDEISLAIPIEAKTRKPFGVKKRMSKNFTIGFYYFTFSISI